MKEITYNGSGTVSRIKRAFGWIVTFRNFPPGCEQTVDGASISDEAVTLWTKGRVELYYNNERKLDRVPGVLSTEIEKYWDQTGEFKLVYNEPSTRVCIFQGINKGRLPHVTKIALDQGQMAELAPGSKILVCLGSVEVADRTFNEESTFSVGNQTRSCRANEYTLLLDFTNDKG
jgi:hypothetical protein